MNYIKGKPVRDAEGKAIKAEGQYLDVVKTFVRQGDTFTEVNRTRKSWLPPEVNRGIIKQMRGIFKIPLAENSAKKRPRPSPEKTQFDAKLYEQTEVMHLQTSKSWAKCNFAAHKNQKQLELAIQSYGQEKYWLRNLRSAGIKILTEGWLEASRWENGNIIWQKVPDVETAIRMQGHIFDSYLKYGHADSRQMLKDKSIGEVASLDSIEEVVAEANCILANWQKSADQQYLSNRLTWAALQFARCRNEFKVGARYQILKSTGLKDGLNRLNPSAMAARTLSALRLINERMAELKIIAPYIAMRHSILLMEKRRLEERLRRAAGLALLLARSWSSAYTPGASSKPARSFLENINLALSYLSSVWLSPFYERARQAEFYLEAARSEIMKKNFKLAQVFFIDVNAILAK